MSDSELELFSESQPNDDLLSPDCSMNELHSSSGSDVESEEDDGGRNRKRPYHLTSVTRKKNQLVWMFARGATPLPVISHVLSYQGHHQKLWKLMKLSLR